MPKNPNSQSTASLGYEAEPWRMAHPLRGRMDATESKHVVLGLMINLLSDMALGSTAERARDTLLAAPTIPGIEKQAT